MAGPNITTSEVLTAYLDCRRNKRGTAAAIEFDLDLAVNIVTLTRELRAHTWRPGSSMCFAVTTPKPREIWAAQFRDRVVHHVIYNRLRPRIEPRFIPTSFACIPGRGTLAAKRWAEQAMRRVTGGWTRPAWTLQMDVANFFVTINHRILLGLLLPHCPEPWLAHAVKQVISSDPRVGAHFPGNPDHLRQVPAHKSLWNTPAGRGLPIGNLTSQFAANVYLNELDQHIQHVLRPRFYGRYVDDLLLVDPDKARLIAGRDAITRYARERLALTMHPGKTRLQRARHGVDFVGYRILPHRTYMRRSTAARAIMAIKTCPPIDLLATTNSYLGIARHADTWRLRKRWAKTARQRGLIAAPDLTKMLARPAPPTPTPTATAS